MKTNHRSIFLSPMQRGGTVYIMTSPDRNVLYTGVTSNLPNRVWKHKNKFYHNSFSAKYNCVILVYYQHFLDVTDAIAEEKRLKGGSRAQKLQLINLHNPDWRDLSFDI